MKWFKNDKGSVNLYVSHVHIYFDSVSDFSSKLFFLLFFLHSLQLYHLLLISNFFAYLFYSLKIQIAVKSHELFN